MEDAARVPQDDAALDPPALLRAARGGDADAGARLLRAFVPGLFAIHLAYARLRGHDPTAARGLASAGMDRTVPAIVTRLHRFVSSRALEPWVWRIGLNVALQRDAVALERDPVALQRGAVGAVALLPGYAAAYALRGLFVLETEAVAAVLGVPADRVSARVRHARRLLRVRALEAQAPQAQARAAEARGDAAHTTAPCATFAESLDAFMDDELLGQDRLRLAKHLGECEPCRTEVEALRRMEEDFFASIRSSGPTEEELDRWDEEARRLWKEARNQPRASDARADAGAPRWRWLALFGALLLLAALLARLLR